MTEPLWVDPAELHFTGAQLDGHSTDFQVAQRSHTDGMRYLMTRNF